MQGTNLSGEGGKKAWYVTPDLRELRLGGREKKKREDSKLDGGKEEGEGEAVRSSIVLRACL